jgi:hypothetical protein
MPYTVTSFDGNFTIDAQTINTANTALALAGKNFMGWGEPYANNFTHLLENFASDTQPSKRRTGQVWYDTANKVIKVWDTRDSAWTAIGQSAKKLANAVNIAISGDATGTTSFDGSTNVSIAVTLATLMTGVGSTANSAANIPGVVYNSPAIVVDSKGRITSLTNSGGDGAGPSQYVSSFTGAVTRSGAVTLTSADVVAALGFTPTANGITGINSSQITSALGYTPANDAAVVHKAGDTMSGTLNMNGNRITGLQSPISGGDPVNLSYLQGVLPASRNVTVSSFAPSGGQDGDVWYRY